MIQKRSFCYKVVEDRKFLALPISAQAVYFHLTMKADDDGFVEYPIDTARAVGGTDADIRALVNAEYLISFEGGNVVCLKHWRKHNTVKPSCYQRTKWQRLLDMLNLVDGVYALADGYTCNGNATATLNKRYAPELPPKSEERKQNIERQNAEELRKREEHDRVMAEIQADYSANHPEMAEIRQEQSEPEQQTKNIGRGVLGILNALKSQRQEQYGY